MLLKVFGRRRAQPNRWLQASYPESTPSTKNYDHLRSRKRIRSLILMTSLLEVTVCLFIFVFLVNNCINVYYYSCLVLFPMPLKHLNHDLGRSRSQIMGHPSPEIEIKILISDFFSGIISRFSFEWGHSSPFKSIHDEHSRTPALINGFDSRPWKECQICNYSNFKGLST